MRKHMLMVILVSLMVLWWGMIESLAQTTYRYSEVKPAPKEVYNTYVSGTNNAGWMVGYWETMLEDGTIITQPFRMSGGKFIDFEIPGALHTQLHDIASNSVIVGQYGVPCDCPEQYYHEWVFTQGFVYIHGDKGKIIPVEHPHLEMWITRPFAINNKGIVVGDYWYGDEAIADAWTQVHFLFDRKLGTFSEIDFPFSRGFSMDYGQIDGINDAQDLVGWHVEEDMFWRGFVRVKGKWSSLNYPGAAHTVARGMNNKGQVVGHWTTMEGHKRGFVLNLKTGVWTDLHPKPAEASNWSFDVVDIDDQGRMAATGYRFSDDFAQGYWIRPKTK
jgi:hypothetical protein